MRKVIFGFLVVGLVLSSVERFRAQTESPTQHLPRGTATDVSSAEIQATVQKTVPAVVSDQAIRVVNVNGEYNVSIGVVHRAKTGGKDAPTRPAASSTAKSRRCTT